MNILVLCTGNSARSILLEAILGKKGTGRVLAYSAGSNPAGKVHPQSLSLLNSLGFDTSDVRSKSWDEFAAPDAPNMDVVITVCSSAANETCPIWPGSPLRANWAIDDPSDATEQDQEIAFQQAFSLLEKRVDALLELPLETLAPGDLSHELRRIGALT